VTNGQTDRETPFTWHSKQRGNKNENKHRNRLSLHSVKGSYVKRGNFTQNEYRKNQCRTSAKISESGRPTCAHAYLSVRRDDKLCRVNTAEGVM